MHNRMKNLAKLFVVGVFVLCALAAFLSKVDLARIGSVVFAQAVVKPTPPAANAAPPAANTAAPVQEKTIPKTFVLSKDSLSEYGDSPFNHENHSSLKYSPDGKSTIGCTECHHTDQPKSALKPPLSTSERDVALTLDVWKKSDKKVSECRACHFQKGDVPEGKTLPSATYVEGDKSTTKDLDNEIAYHINCNNCHDAAFKLRPDLKKKDGFATGKDCTICHKKN